jgi:hypothetical protein
MVLAPGGEVSFVILSRRSAAKDLKLRRLRSFAALRRLWMTRERYDITVSNAEPLAA